MSLLYLSFNDSYYSLSIDYINLPLILVSTSIFIHILPFFTTLKLNKTKVTIYILFLHPFHSVQDLLSIRPSICKRSVTLISCFLVSVLELFVLMIFKNLPYLWSFPLTFFSFSRLIFSLFSLLRLSIRFLYVFKIFPSLPVSESFRSL